MAVTKSSLEHSLAHFNARFLRRTNERTTNRTRARNPTRPCPRVPAQRNKKEETVSFTDITLIHRGRENYAHFPLTFRFNFNSLI